MFMRGDVSILEWQKKWWPLNVSFFDFNLGIVFVPWCHWTADQSTILYISIILYRIIYNKNSYIFFNVAGTDEPGVKRAGAKWLRPKWTGANEREWKDRERIEREQNELEWKDRERIDLYPIVDAAEPILSELHHFEHSKSLYT